MAKKYPQSYTTHENAWLTEHSSGPLPNFIWQRRHDAVRDLASALVRDETREPQRSCAAAAKLAPHPHDIGRVIYLASGARHVGVARFLLAWRAQLHEMVVHSSQALLREQGLKVDLPLRVKVFYFWV